MELVLGTKRIFLEVASELPLIIEPESEFQITEHEGIGYRQHRLRLDGYVYGELSNSTKVISTDDFIAMMIVLSHNR